MFRPVHLALLRVYRRLPRSWRLAVVHGLAPSFTVGAICLVARDDGRVLLVRHSYRDDWGFPGGLLKKGEPVEEGACREVLEEVGIDVELVGEPAVVVAHEPRRVDVIFDARPARGVDADAVAPGSPEIVEVRWFDRDQLPALQHEAAGAVRALARRR